MQMTTEIQKPPVDTAARLLTAAAVLVGLGILAMTYVVLAPIFASMGVPPTPGRKLEMPAYDLKDWHRLAVQHGRTQPFESFCNEVMLDICGRRKFEGQDPVAVVLSWAMLDGTTSESSFTDWETYPFILCDHQGVREKVYEHKAQEERRALTDQERKGKYVSPADLRQSAGFEELLKTASVEHKKDPEKAHFRLSQAQRKAEDVAARLAHFDHLCGKLTSRLLTNALVQGSFFDVQEIAATQDKTAQQILATLETRLRSQPDPLHIVGLDRVPESAWFSLGELRACMDNPAKWRDLLEERLGESPQLYVSPECMQALREFQNHVKAGTGEADVEKLEGLLKQRRDEALQAFDKAYKAEDGEKIEQLRRQYFNLPEDAKRVTKAFQLAREEKKTPDEVSAAVCKALGEVMVDVDNGVLTTLRQGLALTKKKHYHPDDPEFRMMHLGYLESLFPDVYKKSLEAQPFPRKEADQVLEGFIKVQDAYKSGHADEFARESQSFFQLVQETTDWSLIDGLAERRKSKDVQAAFEKVQQARQSADKGQFEQAKAEFFQVARQDGANVRPYPGVTTLALEMLYNRLQPFMWGWIIMLAGVLSLIASMVLRSRYCYLVGFAFYAASLLIQSFGFFTRIYISGRAPVSNMYETVIWVAFMSGIFALVLELIYRRKVILMTGALMSFFGLVLADQLPLALDPKISPLLPVLRSNYWLTVHVLTIVSSYAAGTLAWGLGNISLVLLTFGKGTRETLKMLSQFTYRAIQVAVLLLAAGTFLGGWWAAESWGRFWGWDSKEVGALIALVCYVVPLHARFIGWVKDFGLAVSAIVCYAFIIFSWYVINFVIAAGLHSYGFGGGGGTWVAWAALLNIEWVIVASMIYRRRFQTPRIEMSLAATGR